MKNPSSEPPNEEHTTATATVYPREGIQIGIYTITETLGHGAMATVYKAIDDTDHEVALKIFQEGPGVSRTMLERFRREAEASKKLRKHPHILTIYETGKELPFHYIAMEPIHNSKTLEDALESMPFSQRAIVLLVMKIARALQYAHSRKIIHRDVKPSNIMIDEFGEPLLTDFGVAELVDWPSCTLTGALTGTPLYMSPEQARGERVTAASDIYSLGVVFYECVTGVLPYSTQHSAPIRDVLEAVKHEPPKRPRVFRKDISADLEAVILKAVSKDSRDRYPDAQTFAIDLERVLDKRPVIARRFSPFDKLRLSIRRHNRGIAAGTALLMLGSIVGLYYKNQLMKVHFEQLLTLTQLKNLQYAQTEVALGSTSETPRAWHEIRLAHKAMLENQWKEARSGFQSAHALSMSVGDARTAAIAQLEEARCETMLMDRDRAREIYMQILENPDTSSAIASLAQIECLSLVLLNGNRDAALRILMLREPPRGGPLRAAMNCLGGEIPASELVATVSAIPTRFRNDTYMAIAVRYYIDGELQKHVEYLRACTQSSSPSAEWPGPFAKHLYREILKQ